MDYTPPKSTKMVPPDQALQEINQALHESLATWSDTLEKAVTDGWIRSISINKQDVKNATFIMYLLLASYDYEDSDEFREKMKYVESVLRVCFNYEIKRK